MEFPLQGFSITSVLFYIYVSSFSFNLNSFFFTVYLKVYEFVYCIFQSKKKKKDYFGDTL